MSTEPINLTQSIEARSDQQNADDYMGGPRTFTIDHVSAGSAEQPIDIHLVEAPGKAYRPSKSMRRVMVAAWGPEASTYAGRRLTLYRDPEVTFGRDKVGGLKISHLSHIDKPLLLALTVTRGKRAIHKVDVLPDAPAPNPQVSVETSAKLAALRTEYDTADDARKAEIVAERDALLGGAQ